MWTLRTSSTIPEGSLRVARSSCRSPDAKFDFVTMVSVATHLPADEIAAYAREVMRLLAPGGRLFLTAFLVDLGDDPARTEARPRFLKGDAPGTWIADPAAPLGAIGFDTGIVESMSSSRPAWQIRRVSLGHWRGIESTHYQDIIIAVKPEDIA